jgi:hypothetical protein
MVCEMTFDQYKEHMMAVDPAVVKMIDLGDDTCIMLKRLLFHWTLLRMHIGDLEGYFDRWCYQTLPVMEEAVAEWQSRNWEDEPKGWHRHPMTSRRRPDGDASREYIAS